LVGLVYPFESIQQTKGNTPTQGFIGPPLVDMAKYVAICRKIMHFLSSVEEIKTSTDNRSLSKIE